MMGNPRQAFNDRGPMKQVETQNSPDAETATPRKPLTDAALRASREAEERRLAYLEQEALAPKEIGGRGGNDPARYGDWEIKGRASDF
jgi:hypothetical protein